ncbi:PQQ-binding-like beta-propeller repeat protein [Streptomyces sp. NPDC058685]|uniref:protein kinase domain-containing protein n=1 Tax=Streptomyces sp. NPDC058685 TaxID=3346598 RepID=UPI003667EAF9
MLSPLAHDDPAALGAYRLTARLGTGGMGTVYLARSAGGRTVALKTMHADIASDAGFRSRFRLETDAARIIGGHHGATVVDADPLAATPWLATEYVLGPPLDDAVALAGPLPELSVRALGAALAGALGQLHLSDVVHRDLKPSNVMVTGYGPKIIDFGIARAAGDDHLTRTGSAAGTPAFMSPEQATGLEHTPAGDVFALAGVLVFAASGHGPFGTGQAADLIYRVRYAEPDLTGVPEPLARILSDCLAKDPAPRPTTSELAARLHDGQGQFADHLPDTVLAEIARRASEVWRHQPYRLPAPADRGEPDTTADALPAGMSRRRLFAVTGGSALALAAAGAGAWSWFGGPDGNGGNGGTTPGAAPGTAAGPSGASDEPAPPAGPADKRQTWRKNVRSSPLLFTPVAVGSIVAMMTDGGLLALTAVSGERRWLVDTVRHPRHVHSDGTRLYALLPGSTNGHRLSLHTVDPVSGRTTLAVAFAPFDKPVQEAALLQVSGGTAHLIARKGAPDDSAAARAAGWSVLAVSLGTGRQLWSSPVPAYDIDSPGDTVTSAVAGGRLVLCRTAKDGSALELSARDAATGRLAWTADVPRAAGAAPALTPGTLAADARHVYVGAGRVHALRLTDGKAAWTFGAGRSADAYGVPVLRGDVVYAAEQGRGAVALSAADGSLRWDARAADAPDLRVPPAVDKEHLFLMGATSLRAIGLADRREDWSFRPRSSSLCLHERSKRLVMTDGRQVVAVRLDITF